MFIDLNQLHEDVALKLDDQVFLGKEAVTNVLLLNPSLLEGIEAAPIGKSQMIYGYNQHHHPMKIGFEHQQVIRLIVLTKEISYERFAVEMSFDGTNYAGFQYQKNEDTIQGKISEIITSINQNDTLIQGASRTDAGVHATHYVFHFDTDKPLSAKKWQTILNHQLPKDIYIKRVYKTHPLFHARYDVVKKRYIYRLNLGSRNPLEANHEWVIDKLDTKRLEEEIGQFVGTHNFISFCKGTPETTIRTIYKAFVKKENNHLYLVFEGNGFLRYMVRIMVYTLVAIAQGKISVSVQEILQEKSRKHTKHLAPAEGLYLDQVIY